MNIIDLGENPFDIYTTGFEMPQPSVKARELGRKLVDPMVIDPPDLPQLTSGLLYRTIERLSKLARV